MSTTSYADNFSARMPDGMHLPDAFAQTFDWLEAQGWSTSHDQPRDDPFEQQSRLIYPPEFEFNLRASMVAFDCEACLPVHEPPAEALERITTFAAIDGSGGRMSFWLDGAGKQWIVVIDHGYSYLVTAYPLTELRFLAIGYQEPGAIMDATKTPAERAEMDGGMPDEMPIPPEGFRAFLTETFGVTVPARASDLGLTIPGDGVSDPIHDYMDGIMPFDTFSGAIEDIGTLMGLIEDQPFAISATLRKHLSDEQLEALRLSFPFIVEEE